MPARPSLPLLTTLTAALAVAVAALAVVGAGAGVPPLHIVIVCWLAAAYALGGLVAWRCRPGNRFGPLMSWVGLGVLGGALAWVDTALPHTAGQLLDVLPLVLFTQLFLSYPDGRLHGRPERLIIAVGWVAALGGQLLVMLLGGLRPHALTVLDRPALAHVLHHGELVAVGAVALGGMVLLGVRRRRDGRPLRLSLTLLVDSFGIGMVMIAVLLLVGVFDGPVFPVMQRVSLALLGVAPVAFLAGLLQARLARGAVGDLIIRLRSDVADLRTLLAEALRDPSLQVLYRLPGSPAWSDGEGRIRELPGDASRVTLIDDVRGRAMAALIHDPALCDEPALLRGVSAAAAIVLRTGRLQEQLHANLRELRRSRARMAEAALRERQRLERDLHDGAQQRLVALSLHLGVLQTRLGGDPEAAALLADARTEVAVSLAELRDLARGLHPAVVSAHGLAVAVEQLTARAPVPVRLTVDLPARVAEPVELAAYYVVCESLANIGKHADATSASVDVSRVDGHVVVEVADDGVGGADPEHGTGLRGLADRVEALDGRLRVWTPHGGGTRVRAELPCG